MMYSIPIFGDIDFSSYGSQHEASMKQGVPHVKNMGAFLVILDKRMSHFAKLVTDFF